MRFDNDIRCNGYISQLVSSPRARFESRISTMRVLLVGAGGVGAALARIAARRRFAELVIADYSLDRAQHAAAASDGYEAVRLDARDERAVASPRRSPSRPASARSSA
jgi:shikimate 5-dehydrogenase